MRGYRFSLSAFHFAILIALQINSEAHQKTKTNSLFILFFVFDRFFCPGLLFFFGYSFVLINALVSIFVEFRPHKISCTKSDSTYLWCIVTTIKSHIFYLQWPRSLSTSPILFFFRLVVNLLLIGFVGILLLYVNYDDFFRPRTVLFFELGFLCTFYGILVIKNQLI